MVQAVVQRDARDSDAEIGHVVEVGQPGAARLMGLAEDDILLGTVHVAPSADAALQSAADAGAEFGMAVDHIRVAEALSLDPEYAGGLDAARITAALRSITPKKVAEAKEVAFAKRLSVWRALAAVLYRAHSAPKRTRVKLPEAA